MIESCLTTQSTILCRQLDWVVRLGVTFVAPGEQLNPTRAVHVLELAPLINTDIVSYVLSLAEINFLNCSNAGKHTCYIMVWMQICSSLICTYVFGRKEVFRVT